MKCEICQKRRVLKDGICRQCQSLVSYLHMVETTYLMAYLVQNPEILSEISDGFRKVIRALNPRGECDYNGWAKLPPCTEPATVTVKLGPNLAANYCEGHAKEAVNLYPGIVRKIAE